MAADLIVTLDAGTGSGRCVVFDIRGQPVASAQEPLSYRFFSDPNLPMVRGFDLDPVAFWQTLGRCAREALAQVPAAARIRGVIATSQREGCVFLDRDGEATRVTQASDYLKMYTRFTGAELGGLTVGLVGLGAVGHEVAARLAAFKARILAYDPYVQDPPPGVTLCDLDTLLRHADIVSLHAPVTSETQGLLSAERLALMKPSALFVNTARAALTDENALYDMLRSGRLAGAALDVLAEEPLQPGNRFLALPNVVVTPHLGGATTDVTRHQSDIIVDAMERWLRGERPRWIANPAVLGGRS